MLRIAPALLLLAACSAPTPTDLGTDADGLMAWRGNVTIALEVDTTGAPAHVVDEVRRTVAEQLTAQSSIQPFGSARANVGSGFCPLDVDVATGCPAPTSECYMHRDILPQNYPNGEAWLAAMRARPRVDARLTACATTRAAQVIRIATTWEASSRPSWADPWTGPVRVTYTLTRRF